jgi:hypothetical protein
MLKINKTVGVTTKMNSGSKEPRVLTFRNRLNGETVQVLAGSKSTFIDGVEFMEVLVHGRKNLMRKEHLQPVS